jgi:CheY-like chemotaxis protein
VFDSRKNQAIGALASGIAHDFNNILTAVISQIDLALTAPEFPPSLRENLVYAQTSARRGAELVSKLQVFSRQTKPKIEPLNLLDLIEQVVFMLKRSIDPRVQLQYLPPAVPPWPVKADASYMMQALMNLGLNARDAMPKGGTLCILVHNVTFSEAGLSAPRKAGDFVRLTVGDTGHGMTAEVLGRVFEPYFSTKDASSGPGLGLSITLSIVAEHGGWMEVESRVGQGTQFHIFLPRADEKTAPATTRVTDAKSLEGKERILVVDDDELVRMVTKAVLAYRGYQVIEVEDGEQAIDAYTKSTPPFDLVLMDLHMPRMNGHDALLKIRAINPKVKAIMLSGGLHERDTESAHDLKGVAFLSKPFDNTALTRVVREMLDTPA